jgi:ATP synthase protein I
MADEVGRVRKQRARWRQHGERPLGRNLAMVGVLGWLIVAPTLLGIFIGRWLDRATEAGIFWTGALLILGLAAGCWIAWRWMHEL